MDRHHQQQRLRFLAGTGPFSSETPNSRSTDQSRASPETSTHNPSPLESLFSRLGVSNDTQDLYPRFSSKIFDGSVVNLNSFDGFALSGVYQAGFSTTQNNDINTFGATRIQDFLRNPIIAGSNSDLRTNSSVYCGAYQNHPDFNDRRALVQRESNYRSINNGLVSKNQNSLIRRPLRLQDYLSWEDLSGKVVALAKDPYGCKFLQKLIESATREQIDMLFYEVIGYVGGLIVDPFGNYVVQKLVEVLSEEQRTGILRMLTRTDFQLVRICLDVHGYVHTFGCYPTHFYLFPFALLTVELIYFFFWQQNSGCTKVVELYHEPTASFYSCISSKPRCCCIDYGFQWSSCDPAFCQAFFH